MIRTSLELPSHSNKSFWSYFGKTSYEARSCHSETIQTTRQSTRDISQASSLDVVHVFTLETINWELVEVEERLANLYSQQRQLINWELELIA